MNDTQETTAYPADKVISSLKYFKGDKLAASVWEDKYALRDEQGKLLETNPDEMHKRLAHEFALIEEDYKINEKEIDKSILSHYGRNRSQLGYDNIYKLFKDFKYIIPQGSIMAILGSDKIASLSNCFVIGQPEDSYGGILKKDEELVQLMKRRGGVGIDISTLRPAGTNVTNSAGTSTGAITFMERFSNSTREVAQNGRRGALMITIDVRHPDILDFINIKKDRTKVTGANISVMLRNDFMEAVKNDETYYLRFPCNTQEIPKIGHSIGVLYNHADDDGNTVYMKKVRAKDVYDAIVENAWDNAEPGQMFVDNHWDYSPDDVYPQYKGVTTNPCGEIFMQPYDACRLLCVNLFSVVVNPFTKYPRIDYDKLYQICYEQQRLADDLVDIELNQISKILLKIANDPESDDTKEREYKLWETIYDTCSNGRRTGCGITALADMLAALGVHYDSVEGINIIEDVMRHKMMAELDAVTDLAILRGSFVGWDRFKEDKSNNFYKRLEALFPEHYQRMMRYGRRNISWSTVAPTGSVSILTQTTSGLEPLFKGYYIRRKKVNPSDKNSKIDFKDQNGDCWEEYYVLHPKFKRYLFQKGIFEDKLTKELIIDEFNKSPWYNSTANDISHHSRIQIQQVIQKYTTHSISSTINLPENITKEEVSKIYIEAYNAKLKGVTIYREGSRTGVLVSETKKEDKFEYKDAPKRPKALPCHVKEVMVKGKQWLVIIGLLDNKPYEVFAIPSNFVISKQRLEGTLIKESKGKYRLEVPDEITIFNILEEVSDEEAIISRLISTSLRHGANIQFIVEQLNKSHGDITSFSKAIGRVLKTYVPETDIISRHTCSACKSTNIALQEGCLSCKDCGHSKCG